MYTLVDFQSKVKVSTNKFIFTGENGPWEVVMDLSLVQSQICLDHFRKIPPCLAKYLPFLPVKDHAQFVSLKETATPLIKSQNLFQHMELYFKMEGKNPTGSFKDRGSAVDVTVAKELGAKGIVLASTGNMAASCACYAAIAQMPCFVFVPEGVPRAKLAQVIAFGGRIIQVKGTYNDAARLAEQVAKEWDFYLAGDYAFRVEGQKTAAFELIDQLLFDEPDMVIVPIGCGTNMAAYAKGFQEYHTLGLIKKLPRLVGVQAESAAAVVHSFKASRKTTQPVVGVNTIASAIAVSDPLDGVKALDAIYSTKGLAVSVTDEEILKAQYLLSSEEGLFVETASASTFAALAKIASQEDLKGKKVVCVLTGDGLKDASSFLKEDFNPPTIYPSKEEFAFLYEDMLVTVQAHT